MAGWESNGQKSRDRKMSKDFVAPDGALLYVDVCCLVSALLACFLQMFV